MWRNSPRSGQRTPPGGNATAKGLYSSRVPLPATQAEVSRTQAPSSHVGSISGANHHHRVKPRRGTAKKKTMPKAGPRNGKTREKLRPLRPRRRSTAPPMSNDQFPRTHSKNRSAAGTASSHLAARMRFPTEDAFHLVPTVLLGNVVFDAPRRPHVAQRPQSGQEAFPRRAWERVKRETTSPGGGRKGGTAHSCQQAVKSAMCPLLVRESPIPFS